MRKHTPPSTNPGQNPDNAKPLSVEYLTMTTESESNREEQKPKARKNGSPRTSEDSPKTTSSESENEPSLKNKKEPRLLPVPKPIRSQDRTKEALKRLGVSEQELTRIPQITPQLKKAAGGLKAVLNAMRSFCDDPDIANFLEKYDSIPSGDRERIPWEAIAISAGISVKHLLGAIIIALQADSVTTVKILAVTNHPKIVRARIKYGKLAGGEKDRTALDTAMGFLPSPKGPTFIGKAVISGHGGNITSTSDDGDVPPPTAMFDEDADLDQLFPSASVAQEKIVAIRQKMLEKP